MTKIYKFHVYVKYKISGTIYICDLKCTKSAAEKLTKWNSNLILELAIED